MAGSAVNGELRARERDLPPWVRRGAAGDGRDPIRFAVATAADESALRRLLRDNPMRGAISLSLEREPDYFHGTHLAGASDVTVIAHESDRLICMGRCTTRACWINGTARQVAYLGELRLDRSAHGRFAVLRGGYRFFHELHRRAPAEFTFTSIAADNTRARRLLERGLPGLPHYEFLTEFVTLLLPVAKLIRRPARPLGRATPDELVATLNVHAQRHQFATVWSEERVAGLEQHGLRADDFAVHRSADGRIAAAAALWDQRNFRQTVVRGYSPALACARPVLNCAARVFGTVHLPPVGSIVAHAFVSPLAVGLADLEVLPGFIAGLANRAAQRGVEFLTLGFAGGDPRLAVLRTRLPHRAYLSRLYRVIWPGAAATLSLDPRPILPDIALL